MVTPAQEPSMVDAPGWDHAVEAHLRVLRAVQPASVIEILARRAGFAIDPGAGNAAASYADVLRYLRAVQDVLGHAAWLSAKLLIVNRMREAGLTTELPRAERAWTGPGAAGRRGPGNR